MIDDTDGHRQFLMDRLRQDMESSDDKAFRAQMQRAIDRFVQLDPAVLSAWMAAREARERQASTPVTVDEISRLSDDELDDRLIGRLFHVLPSDMPGLKSQNALLRAWYTTKDFEGEVMNGGMHQFFCNRDDLGEPYWDLVLEGYETLALPEVRSVIEDEILPVARDERSLRSTLSRTTDFVAPYDQTRLAPLDDLIEVHDEVRTELVRRHPEVFAI